MEVYWRLASVDASEREAASVELVQGLLLQQQHADKPVMKNNKAEKTQPTEDFDSAHKQTSQSNQTKLEEEEDQEKRSRKRKGSTTLNNQTEEEKEEVGTPALQGKRARKRKRINALKDQTKEETVEEAVLGLDTQTEKDGSHFQKEGLCAGAFINDDGLDNCSPAVQYALKRLIRGVASSRECARQGFAMGLASLLEALPYIKIESVLKLIKTSLQVASSMKGQEKRDGLLGQLFALGAVVRSGRLVVDDTDMEAAKLAKDISEQLLCLAKRKVFLREPAITVLLCFIEKLPPGVLQETVFSGALLQETLCMDLENANTDTLFMALKLHKLLPSSVLESCPLLPKTKSTHALFEPSHLVSLAPILKESSSCHPRVHPVWNFLIELMLRDSNDHGLRTPSKKKRQRQKLNDVNATRTVNQQQLASFWNLVVTKSLLTHSHERKFLAMELLQLVLHELSPACAEFILSRTFVRCLLDILAAKGNLLYKSAQTCLESVCEWAKADEQRIVTVIISLQHASHGKFDILSKTQTVNKLVSLLTSKGGCFLLYKELVELFIREKSLFSATYQLHVVDEETDQIGIESDEREEKDNTSSGIISMEAQRCWVIEQITSFVKHIKEQDLRYSLQKEALKFLTFHALFVGPSGGRCHVKDIQEDLQFPEPSISENIRKLCLARLQNLLVNVSPPAQDINISGEKEENIQKSPISTDLRFFFLDLCDIFDKIPDVSRVQPVSEDDKDVIIALRLCFTQLCSVDIKANNELTQKMRSMCTLLMQFLLQSATAGVNDIAYELILCCKKAFGELIEVDANGVFEEEEDSQLFMDVLVDILLSLLAQSSAPIRAAAEQVFKSFCGDLMESNMLSLLRVVKKQLKSARRVAATLVDTAESDEDQFLEVEDSDYESDVIDGGENDNEKDASNDDNAEEPEPKRLQRSGSKKDKVAKKKESMQTADPDSEMSKEDSDLEDGSDMDDEAMFKIDVHLANLLKQRRAASGKSEGKDAQTQLTHFKFRVLSLIEYFFQKKASSPLCLTALPHLMQAFVMSSGAGGNALLAERISSILQGRLFKSKEYPKGMQVDKEALTGLLQRCLRLAARSKIKKVGQVAQSCSLWLLKVLHGQPSHDGGDREKLIKEVQDALKDFFSQKKCRFRAPYFRDLFRRFPGIGLACLGLLLDSCKNARSEFLQHEALLLVTSIFHFNTGKKSGTFKESLIQHLPALSEVLVGVIEKPPSNKARKTESRRFCISLLKAVAQELPEKPVKKLIGNPAYNLCLSSFGASVTEGIKGVSSVTDGEGTTKKRTICV